MVTFAAAVAQARAGQLMPLAVPAATRTRDFPGVPIGAETIATFAEIAHRGRRTRETAGDDVAADPPLGSGGRRSRTGARADRESPGSGCRSRRSRDGASHAAWPGPAAADRYRQLRGMAQRVLRAAAMHVTDAQHVGQEKPVGHAAPQQRGSPGPGGRAELLGAAVARVGPEAGRDMPHRVHRDGVQRDLARHGARVADAGPRRKAETGRLA